MADRSAARRTAPGPKERNEGLAAVAGQAGTATSLELDRLIHERVRLAIVSALAVAPLLTFAELKQVLGTTDGNLSVHARKLEEAGYISCRKSFVGRVPRTEYSLTKAGRGALERYVGHMEDLIRMVKGDEG
ncbi:MAG TPA: transcriptional regulator [Gemmatimonadales bacterium]|nr:transcriptional regulator [Gemmatimonadales bacterium]